MWQPSKVKENLNLAVINDFGIQTVAKYFYSFSEYVAHGWTFEPGKLDSSNGVVGQQRH